ncbi:MAG: M24 family metallopeptidase [Steroidobacteraceae bacterium]
MPGDADDDTVLGGAAPDAPHDDAARRAALVAAEQRAIALLDEIEAAGVIVAGRTELQVQDDIHALARQRFGIERYWHRRIVRAGPNTLTIASDHPAVRTLGPDDTVYVDLGPVFEAWEADVGRTYALGRDPDRRRLVADLPRVFERVQRYFHASTVLAGAQLYAFAQRAAQQAGWEFGGAIAGHVVGEFAHNRWPGDRELARISPRNSRSMRAPDHLGRPRHWILEIHLVDRARTFGGFYERLL